MKILLINLNVGSAIEYLGNILHEWIEEIDQFEIYTYKDQTLSYITSKTIKDINPDIIIVNDYFRRIMDSVFYHKLYNKCKIIYILHAWKSLESYAISNDINENYLYKIFINECVDSIICINKMPDKKIINSNINFFNLYPPINPNIFHITTPWENRKKTFFYMGNILPHKLSLEFIQKNNIDIDCYGKIFENNDYIKEFNNNKHLRYCGYVKQDDVPQIMNQYKYYVLPHGEVYEPFNWTLLQAILCGCIPLVCNNRNSNKFDCTWIDWAESLYFGCNSINELISNMYYLDNNINYSQLSEENSINAKNRFDYYNMKNIFKELLLEFSRELHK